jgi:hypothetical protein
VPRVDEWHGLSMEARLEQQNIAEVHARPQKRDEDDQEVVAMCAGFPWGQAELQCLVFAWPDPRGGGQSFDSPSLMWTLRSSGTVRGVQVIIQIVVCSPGSRLACWPIQ